MKLKEKSIIEKEKLIIVEGGDDENFIDALLKKLEINDVEIINIGGNNFDDYVPEIGKITGFDKVKQLLVIGDADNNSQTAFDRIKRSIEEIEDYNLIPPQVRNSFNNDLPQIGIYIITKPNSEEGILEDLCLETVKNHPVMKCVEIFCECISELDCEFENPSKSKCKTFLSGMPISVPHIGVGAQKNYWNLESEILDKLKSFLITIKS